MRRKKIAEPPVYEKGSNETTLDPPPGNGRSMPLRLLIYIYSLLSNAYVVSDANLCITYKSKHTESNCFIVCNLWVESCSHAPNCRNWQCVFGHPIGLNQYYTDVNYNYFCACFTYYCCSIIFIHIFIVQ